MRLVGWGDAPKEAWRPGNETRLHASAAGGSERLCVGEQWFAPGTGAPTHHHPEDVEEVISVIAGAMDFHLDGERATLLPGQAVIIPGGAVHGFVARGDQQLHIWGAFSSAAPKTFFVEHPDEVIEIGGVEGDRLDSTRTRRAAS
jgi:quercetin dioxygenase-like cupin family protein